MNNTLVSIIIPIYNASTFLKECLDSVINQTYKYLQIICINDCSTDDSLDILKYYSSIDQRLLLIDKKTNTGCGDSMNIGFREVKGSYFMIVEPDDYLELNAVKTLLEKIEHNDVLISNTFFRISNGNKTKIKYYPREELIDKNNFETLLKCNYCYNWNRLYKKDFITWNEPWINTPKASFQDQYFNYVLLCHKPNIKIIDYVFYNYRIHGDNSIFNVELAKYTLEHVYKSKKYKISDLLHVNYWFSFYQKNFIESINSFIVLFKQKWNEYMSWYDILLFLTSNQFSNDYKMKVLQTLDISEENNEYVICCCVKNEENYILEWVNYHLELGFDKIYLYINDDINKYQSILEKNINNNQVILFDIDNIQSFQTYLYNLAYKILPFKWCAFIDCDEFITLHGYTNIKDYINSFPRDCQQICLNWLCYGSNGNKKYNPIPIQKRMPFCGTPIEHIIKYRNTIHNLFIKSIIKKNANNKNYYMNPHISLTLNDTTYDNAYKKITNLGSILPYRNHQYNIAYIKHYYVRDIKYFFLTKLFQDPAFKIPQQGDRVLSIENLEYPTLPPQLLQIANIQVKNTNELMGKKILCKNQEKLIPLLKKDLNILYCGDLKNNNIFINIANYNKCYYNWVLPELFDNVYNETDFDLIIE